MLDRRNAAGPGRGEIAAVLAILCAVALTLSPMFATSQEDERKAKCQSNLKELGTALALYCADYDATLPSSALNGGSGWNELGFKRFATLRGTLPPPMYAREVTWPMVLYLHLKSAETLWCPSDNGRRDTPSARVSYWWKAAVDRAWYGGQDSQGYWSCKKEGQFEFPADQIVFYELAGWHWGEAARGLSEGVHINATFMDGHVKTIRLRFAGSPVGKSYPTAAGAPGWFNYDYEHSRWLGRGRFYDPRQFGDNNP